MLVRIGPSTYLNPDEVLYIMPSTGATAQKIYNEAKEKDQVLNMTRGKAKKSLIILKSGLVILSDFLPDTMYNKISDKGMMVVHGTSIGEN